MITVKLLGELGKKFGRTHVLAIRSPAEAVRALCANFDDFERFVVGSSDRGVGYKVLTGKAPIGVDQLHDPASKSITIAPVIAGAGGSSVGQIILGAALIAAAFFVPALAAVALPFGGSLATVAFGVGVSLAIGGIAQLLTPVPKQPKETEASYLFDGAVNTTAQGNPVPIGYGRLLVGSAVISAGIEIDKIS